MAQWAPPEPSRGGEGSAARRRDGGDSHGVDLGGPRLPFGAGVKVAIGILQPRTLTVTKPVPIFITSFIAPPPETTTTPFVPFTTYTVPIDSHLSNVKSNLAAPLAGGIAGFAVLAGILTLVLLYRRRKRTKRQDNYSHHPEPFNTVQIDRLLNDLPVTRDSLRKQHGNRLVEASPNGPSANVITASAQASNMAAGPSSLEETQREVRELRELVLRMANGGQSTHETESVDTGVTPPPVYTTERGSNTPVDTSSPEPIRIDTSMEK